MAQSCRSVSMITDVFRCEYPPLGSGSVVAGKDTLNHGARLWRQLGGQV